MRAAASPVIGLLGLVDMVDGFATGLRILGMQCWLMF